MKLLIFNPFGIGDVLFTTPLIRAIKEAHPEYRVWYICNRRVYPLLKGNPRLEDVLVFEKDEWRATARNSKIAFITQFTRFFHQIRSIGFNAVFDFSLSTRYSFFLKSTGIPQRIGPDVKGRGRFLTHKTSIPYYKDMHVARYYSELVRFLGIEPVYYPLELSLSEDDAKNARETLRQAGVSGAFAAVIPGSGDSWGKDARYKRWPPESFSRLCDLVGKDYGLQVVLFGSSSECLVSKEVASLCECVPVDMTGKLCLKEFAAAISLARIVVTNDGGPLHIAQALGKKVIALFGPVDENVYGCYPKSPSCVVFSSQSACRPCYREFKFKGCLHNQACLRAISPEAVFGKLKEMLVSSGVAQ